MSDLFWAVWLIDFLSSVGICLFIGALVGIFAAFLFTLTNDEAIKVRVSVVLGALLISVLCAMVPTKQTMYVMLGVKMTDNVMQSDLGKKIQQIVNTQLDELVGKYGVKKESK